MLTALCERNIRPHCLAIAGSILKYCDVESHALHSTSIAIHYLIKGASYRWIQWSSSARGTFEAHRMRIHMVCDGKDEQSLRKMMRVL